MRRFAIVVACLCLTTPVLADRTFGLVIGIDAYDHLPDLDGAVNDARDIADALGTLDAEVTVLLNGDATRDRIFSAWRAIAQRMHREDQLIVTFAGHGSNEPDLDADEEEDGRDENLLLAGFQPYGPGAAERIRDDEIADLVASVPGGQVILVADSCHSGTLSRTINPPLGYRYVSVSGIENDPLPPPPPNSSKDADAGNVALFLAAVNEANKVPEFMIDGQVRGALSFSFARAIRGLADNNMDRQVTQLEVSDYVRRSVRDISHGLQSPQITFSGDGQMALVNLQGVQSAPPPAQASVFEPAFDDLPPVSVHSPDRSLLDGIDGAAYAATPKQADLTYDAATGHMLTMAGDRAGFVGDLNTPAGIEALQKIADKMRFVRALSRQKDELDVQFASGDRNYAAGEVVTVQIVGRQSDQITLMNISADATINYLYPLDLPSQNISDPVRTPVADRLNLPMQVVPPFGSDHIFALETSADPKMLRTLLATYNSNGNIRDLWAELRQVARVPGQDINTAVFAFQTLQD